MTFDKIIKHLEKRGFATRKSWQKQTYVFFGLDNCFLKTLKNGDVDYYVMSLADIKAKDWEVIAISWETSTDDRLPFKIDSSCIVSEFEVDDLKTPKVIKKTPSYLIS